LKKFAPPLPLVGLGILLLITGVKFVQLYPIYPKFSRRNMVPLIKFLEEKELTTEFQKVVRHLCDGDAISLKGRLGISEDYIVKQVDSYGGEGLGESAWVIFCVTEPSEEQYFMRINLYYSSYNGMDWDSWERNSEIVVQKEILRKEWVAE
jgi:hypothetical protein